MSTPIDDLDMTQDVCLSDVTASGAFPTMCASRTSGVTPSAATQLLSALRSAPKYQIGGVVAKGGMGAILDAKESSLDRVVAMKVMLNNQSPTALARFLTEAKVTGQLEHPNIVPVHELGVDEKQQTYYTMKFVRGITLRQVLEKLAKSDVETVKKYTLAHLLTIFQKVCDAMAFAHSRGVIHRDLKPENVMLGDYGEVLVMDWGLAKVLGEIEIEVMESGEAKLVPSETATGTQNTLTGAVLGTLAYMAPEQATGEVEKQDQRSDIYALGGILYHVLVLKTAVEGKSSHAAIQIQITKGQLVPPEKAVSRTRRLPHLPGGQIPESLSAVVMKAMALEQKDRYQSIPELQRDIAAYQSGFATSAEHAGLYKQVTLLVKRNKGVFATAFAAWFIITALLAWFVLNLRASEKLAKEQKSVAEKNLVKAEKAEKDATEQRNRAENNLVKATAAEKDANEQRNRADDQAEGAQQNLYYAQMHLGQQAWREHRGLPHMQELLNNWLHADELPDRRGWEWFFLNSLPYQNLRTLTKADVSKKALNSIVAWHAASRRLAVGTNTGVIRIWDVDREQTTLVLNGPGTAGGTWWEARWFAWSPDGRQIAAGFHDGTVHLWDTVSGQELNVLRGRKSLIYAVAYSSDGLRLATWAYEGKIRIWDLKSGLVTAEITHPEKVSSGAWSPDDKILAAGHSDGSVTLSGTQTGDKVVNLRGHTSQVHAIAWNPESTQLASASYDHTIAIWDVAAKKMRFDPLRHSHEVTSVAWEPNGKRLATGSIDETVKIWNMTTGHEELTLRGHRDMVTSLAWGPKGGLASGGHDGSVRIWDSICDQEWSVLPGNGVRATAVVWSPNGKRLATGGDDGTIRILDPASRGEILSIKAHDELKVSKQYGLIRALAWSPDGTRLVSGGLDGAAKVWDAESGDEVFGLPAHHGMVWSVAWSPDGAQLAVGSEDGTIRVVEGLKRTPKITLIQAHKNSIRALAWSPLGDRLASGGADMLAKVWDSIHGNELARMQGHQYTLTGVAWSPDGKRLASAGADRLLFTWDAETGRKLMTMRGHNDFVDSVDWSPDGLRLASAGIDNSVRVWDPRTGEEAFVLRGNTGMFHAVAWHPNGAQLAAASSDGQIWIWDATRGFEQDTTSRALPFIDRMISAKPVNDPERLRFAQLAYDHKKFGIAARLWAEALSINPALGDDVQTQLRFHAARAASLAAAGKGRDEPPADDAAKAKLRGKAIGWLRAELVSWGKLLASSPPDNRDSILMQLTAWKHDTGLAAIRDPEVVTQLPPSEQTPCAQFWADVAGLLNAENFKQEAFLQEKLVEARRTLPEDSADLAYLLSRIARINLEQEKWAGAESLLRECLAIREKAMPDSWLRFNTISSLGGALLGQKKFAEAEPLLLEGYKGMIEREATIPLIGKDRVPEALDRLITLYVATDKPAEVKKWRAERAK